MKNPKKDKAHPSPTKDTTAYADLLKQYEVEAERMAALSTGEMGTEEEQEAAWEAFGKLLRECVSNGGLWVPERVRALYPILREIKDDIDSEEGG